MTPGCPRHPSEFSPYFPDFRCRRNGSPEGAPSPDEQLRRWAEGDPTCPNSNHECCPDFSCCRPNLLWPADRRAKFVTAGQSERKKMMITGFTGPTFATEALGTASFEEVLVDVPGPSRPKNRHERRSAKAIARRRS